MDLLVLSQFLEAHGLRSVFIVPALCFLLAIALRMMFFRIIEGWIKRQNLIRQDFDPRRHFRPLIFLFLFAILLKTSLPLVHLPRAWQAHYSKTLAVFVVLTATWFAIRCVGLLREMLFHAYSVDAVDNLKQRKIRTQISYLTKFVNVALAFLGFCFLLVIFDGARRIGTSLVTSAGLVTVIAGFAAQKTLSNIIAGFSIAFTQPIRLDDVVVVEGQWGRIEEISLTYVVVALWDWRRLVLPITYFVEKPFENWTRTTARIIGQVHLELDFAAPLDKLREQLAVCVNTSPLWDRDVSVLQVTGMSDRAMQVRILVSARNSKDSWDLRCVVREHLIAYLGRHYGQAFPKQRYDDQSSKTSDPSLHNQARSAKEAHPVCPT